jgi:hypothetical protein
MTHLESLFYQLGDSEEGITGKFTGQENRAPIRECKKLCSKGLWSLLSVLICYILQSTSEEDSGETLLLPFPLWFMIS